MIWYTQMRTNAAVATRTARGDAAAVEVLGPETEVGTGVIIETGKEMTLEGKVNTDTETIIDDDESAQMGGVDMIPKYQELCLFPSDR